MSMVDSSTHSRANVSSDGDLPIPPNLKRKLEDFQNRLWSIKIAEELSPVWPDLELATY